MKTPKDYIIFPLDLPDYEQALGMVDRLRGHVGLFKVGLELFIAEGPKVLEAIRSRGGAGIFLDLKLNDIPATVKRALSASARYQPHFVTIHAEAMDPILEEIPDDIMGSTRILAVTVLTSLHSDKLIRFGCDPRLAADIPALVLMRARAAKEAGCHGVVCSGQEVRAIKAAFGPGFIAVTPGIRPAWSMVAGDDQKRIVTAAEAVRLGADYLVVGRPIRDAADPAEAADRLAEEIASAL
ncbi:Orotidine 5'-phosphate decarboxylase [uncultured Desulfatiglans sp.]|uniref:Orotidine 5'-phosphate decarboxylase n=1 Tax=Uncultured Desulfatiglans sp. TaxID=1748965 RepID=A0A653AE55_UNCDX|nr:Orotidine 5'-phosphate decarboxylase [uncultured Desulfatiglans sp.]